MKSARGALGGQGTGVRTAGEAETGTSAEADTCRKGHSAQVRCLVASSPVPLAGGQHHFETPLATDYTFL